MTAFDDLTQIVREECSAAVADRVLMRLRDTLGAQRVYVPAKSDPDLAKGDTVETIRTRHRVSRATAYNWINRYRV